MAVYLYETTDPGKPVQQFELRQGMTEDALTEHPDTGEPIRRVISGGFGFMVRGGARSPMPASAGGHCCGAGCGCG